MSPNFVLLDAALPDVARLVAAMVEARDAVERRSWSPTCLRTLVLESESGGHHACTSEPLPPSPDHVYACAASWLRRTAAKREAEEE
jgi:hypothetical protein